MNGKKTGALLFACMLACGTAVAADNPDLQPKPINVMEWIDFQRDLPAIDLGLQDVTFAYRLQVDPKGFPTSCEVMQSSGSERMDGLLCNLLIERASFEMPSSAAGEYTGAIKFSVPAEPVGGEVAVSAFINDDGDVESCDWIGEDHPPVDPQPLCEVRSWKDARDTDGELIRGRVTNRFPVDLAAMLLQETHTVYRLRVQLDSDLTVTSCEWNAPPPRAIQPMPVCLWSIERQGLPEDIAGPAEFTILLDDSELSSFHD
jgi:hypothetical protein